VTYTGIGVTVGVGVGVAVAVGSIGNVCIHPMLVASLSAL
jgi:hypothetical protein